MKKIIFALIAGLILFMTILSGSMVYTFIKIREEIDETNHIYEVNIQRSSDEVNGVEMIETAERIYYSSIFNSTPRDVGPMPFFKPVDERANYVSSENIEFYSNHVEEMEDNHTFGHYKLKYTATAERIGGIELVLRESGDTVGKGSGLYYHGSRVGFSIGVVRNLAYYNGTSLVTVDMDMGMYIPETFVTIFSNCYLIDMYMEYEGKPGPDEGGGFDLRQYVVLNEEGELMFVYSFRIDFGKLDDIFDTPW